MFTDSRWLAWASRPLRHCLFLKARFCTDASAEKIAAEPKNVMGRCILSAAVAQLELCIGSETWLQQSFICSQERMVHVFQGEAVIQMRKTDFAFADAID